ncbi:MAG: hypothetical protein JO017_08040, partial [Actinobacteria bacterium]|nr:hypothetical protein [Actinomycetota bacterium]
ATGKLVCTASISSDPGDSNPANNTAANQIVLGSTAPTVTPTASAAAPAPVRLETTAAPALTAVLPVKAVSVTAARPAVTVTTMLTQTATVHLVLVDAKGHVLATLTKVEKPGKVGIAVPLPKAARVAGRDTLKVTVNGKTKAVPVVLRA